MNSPAFIHVSSATKKYAETERRETFAHQTWQRVYSSGNWTFVTPGNLRLHSEERLPLVRDVFDLAAAESRSGLEMIVMTNADVCAASNVEVLLSACGHIAYSHRHDVQSRVDTPIPDSTIGNHPKYPGVDIFSITVALWNSIRHDYPDMLIGREAWDAVMLVLFNENKAVEIPHAFYHEAHSSYWCKPENINSLPGQRWNRHLAYEWMVNRHVDPATYNIPNPNSE